jgi:hypothetical protein
MQAWVDAGRVLPNSENTSHETFIAQAGLGFAAGPPAGFAD